MQVFFKTPDAVDDAIEAAVRDIEDDDEREEAAYDLKELARGFVEFGETVRIEFDTSAWTVKVVPCL